MEHDQARPCPLCKELIHPAATRCKHCGSTVAPARLEHGGTCPLCKEAIHPEAVVCKHCRSDLRDRAECSCTQTGMQARRMSVTPVGQCQTWCVGATLMCACPVRTPYGTGQLVYPCGTCINDPVFTARETSARPG